MEDWRAVLDHWSECHKIKLERGIPSQQNYIVGAIALKRIKELEQALTDRDEVLRELEAKVKRLRELVALHREQKLEKDVTAADRRLWELALDEED